MVTYLLVVAVLCSFVPSGAAERREALLRTANAYWKLSDGGKGAKHPLSRVGRIELGLAAQGAGAIAGSKVARLTEGYFKAGKELNVQGDQITVYLRVRDPGGQWSYALFCKRGSHAIVNFNLFSVDLPNTPGTDIGFELHSEAGFVMVSFPVSRINPRAWHDLVGRYDGKTIELICDGLVMVEHLWRGGNLTQNDEPVLIGAETDQGRIVRPFIGELEEAALWSRALREAEIAQLTRKEKIMPDLNFIEPYVSPIHYRPAIGRLADTIPFFWKGDYHIFYLCATDKVPWEHIVSTELVHWKELPTALRADGDPSGPDGQHMFTGSVIERSGVFHIFYTGHNDRNPQGNEFIMHATSPDLIKWTKHPEDMIAPDGIHYSNKLVRNFRDPYVFWNEKEQRYWMVVIADDVKTGQVVQGVLVSDDLEKWAQVDPLAGVSGQECPDMFRIGDTCYLLGGSMYRWAKDLRGPYSESESPVLDTPFLYAGKRMFDGKRHVWTAWLRDLAPERDGEAMQWGGTQCVPRELYAGPKGQLYARPVPEATAVFTRTVLDLGTKPRLRMTRSRWGYKGSVLVGESVGTGSQCAFDVPANYMLQCKVQMEPKAVLRLVMREQGEPGLGYQLVLRPETQESEIGGPDFRYPRKIILDASKPIGIQAFVQGTMIECFINDAFAFSCRSYNFPKSKLGLNVSGGKAKVIELSVKTHKKEKQ